MSIEFWVTSIALTAAPGTGSLFTIAAGLARGAGAGVVAALGCAVGILPHLALALSGAAALLAASPVAFESIRWLGVAYLLYLAWGAWRRTGVLALDAEPAASGPPPGARAVITTAVLINLLNPKLTLFFLVFLPMFVDPDAEFAVLEMAVLGAAVMGLTAVIFAVYGVSAGWLRRFVVGRPRVMTWLGRVFAGGFAALAVMLALTPR